ncbi:MAG: TlpA family protein disulfide reductase [Bacillota bacterium]|uniref:TlpA family protein disulfide reductase n=1 Tax=Virgibacillus salarius TaxID=447199 RepID=A0A941E009_9BACI|nr:MULTISPECIES: TlpA disulfide reductase family protein [Bacillaceae]NAZ09172.1 redoxin domain-containing protein [Agaribacter marinus]MBR7796463.1 TlpA family protein disulfide reductase [Virgibacillus salarius]MCC2251159.1 TlpA family protein disulfide reductase [Virgibacillus sp. AGTR]MDY7045321.1 TlpA disulfide reductase family protein [Virgibacillus sp. M23]QRZ16808.1 TlpA family protein disulfide reductase [Virgibacillus sp. AGTR]
MRLRDEMPELNGATNWLNSDSITKEDLIGSKPTFIHFWSVSCHLCKKAIPRINQLRDTYQGNLQVISVHIPRSISDKNMKKIKLVVANYGMHEPIIVDNNDEITDAFGLNYVPSFYLFDKSGILRFVQKGKSNTNMLEQRIQRLVHAENN